MKLAPLASLVALSIAAACSATPEFGSPSEFGNAGQAAPQAIIAHKSTLGFEETVDKLRSAIEARPLTLFAEIDHAKGARDAGLTLSPSTLFIFGNPSVGAPLMQANPALGIELPMKILVVDTGSGVQLIRQDIPSVLRQYAVSPTDVPVDKIEETLIAITTEASR
ncbi:DUF302 domain-containing protein [Henriciella sp. AS95]|uniref:DUF302 domain-containing protein n=1 Tax=Henriciella sp. AS95 TaxID=3135782 RepID=UPI00318033E7